ncbi:hypothetical protein ABFA07_012734 [Porites harrisoni]
MTAMYIPQFANSAELRHWQGVRWDETRKSRRRFLKRHKKGRKESNNEYFNHDLTCTRRNYFNVHCR